MINIVVLNRDNKEVSYSYKDAKELEKIWRSDDIDMNVPENDAELVNAWIDDKCIYKKVVDYGFKRNGTDSVWFEDFLTYLGIEIW